VKQKISDDSTAHYCGHGAACAYSSFILSRSASLKRGIYGCYFHVSEAHLHRYTAEFDFRHNNRIALGVDDFERADRVLIGAKGKRLTYATPRSRIAGEPPF
jgi:hypothetical protein